MYIQDKRNPNKHIQSSHDMHNKLAFIKTKPPANKNFFFISNIISNIFNLNIENATEQRRILQRENQ